MTLTISRKVSFCAGHRLCGHESRCAMAHGHNYVAYFHARSRQQGSLDPVGRVIDFGVLKQRLGGWIDEFWDHAFIVWEQDDELRHALESVRGQRIFLLPENPTAENMASYLLNVVGPLVLADTAVELVKVQLWETENCCAEVSAE